MSTRPTAWPAAALQRPRRNTFNPEGDPEDLPSKVTRTVYSGDVLRHEQPGGGGYGDPAERPVEAVAADVFNQKISTQFAAEQFGVCLPKTAWSRILPQRRHGAPR